MFEGKIRKCLKCGGEPEWRDKSTIQCKECHSQSYSSCKPHMVVNYWNFHNLAHDLRPYYKFQYSLYGMELPS